MSDTAIILQKLEALTAKIDRMERRIWLQDKAAYTQEEIVEALGLTGKQKNLLAWMKETGLLHSPINKSPLIYPASVVHEAIKAFNSRKVEQLV
jgi:hypothetical protein